jgi:hypothetical protein
MTKSKRGLSRLMRERPDDQEFVKRLNQIGEADHPASSVALMSAALLDHGLSVAISNQLPNLKTHDQREGLFEGEGAPLSSFAAKIRLANAMDILADPLASDFQTVRRVRNAFAHTSSPITFDTPEIIDEIEGMNTWTLMEVFLNGDGDASTSLSRKERYGGLVFLMQFALTASQVDWAAIRANFEEFLGSFTKAANSLAISMKSAPGDTKVGGE